MYCRLYLTGGAAEPDREPVVESGVSAGGCTGIDFCLHLCRHLGNLPVLYSYRDLVLGSSQVKSIHKQQTTLRKPTCIEYECAPDLRSSGSQQSGGSESMEKADRIHNEAARHRKVFFCLTGPYLTGRATIGRLELPPGEGRFVGEAARHKVLTYVPSEYKYVRSRGSILT